MLDFEEIDRRIADPARIGAVDLLLASPVPTAEIERLMVDLAARLRTPLAAATALDGDTQHLLATNVGPTPSHGIGTSHCQYVIGTGTFLCIEDATTQSTWRRLSRRLANGMEMAAWLGFPLRYRGEVIGSVCVVDVKRREWTTEEQYEVYAASRKVADLIA